MGGWGIAASFSFHPLKNLHAFGDAGILTTDDSEIIRQLEVSKSHGLSSRDRCEFLSLNCRLDEVQAALLRIQLRQLNLWTDERRRLAFRYHQLLSSFVRVPEEALGNFMFTKLMWCRRSVATHSKSFCVAMEWRQFFTTPPQFICSLQQPGSVIGLKISQGLCR